jgi:FkbM family methyltransferase
MRSSKRETLTRFTRTMAKMPGFWRVTRLLERSFPIVVGTKEDSRFVTIDNYDDDLKLRVDITSYMGGCVYWQGYYSREELLLLDRILEPKMTFVDIGANNGYFTTFAAKRLREGMVLSFEPVPEVFQNLEYNVQLNEFNNVQLLKLGLSDGSKEEVGIYSASKDRNADGLSTTFPSATRDQLIATIQLKRFDDVLEELNVERVDIIKIDIEGGELPALLGASNTLEKDRPQLIIEFNDETFKAAGYSIKNVTEFLDSFGYKYFSIGIRGSLHETRSHEINQCAFSNVLCRVA